jgi:succinyl-diaminopimelate desuccinylase
VNLPTGATAASLAGLVRDLVRIPSRAGADPPDLVLEAIARWLSEHGIAHELLRGEKGAPLAVYVEIEGGAPGPTHLLSAPVDTAPIGDPLGWRHGPFSAEVADGWLYGRGSADSKAGIAIFCHVAAALAREADRLRGTLVFAFDAEEHSGTFLGIRRCIERRRARGAIDGAMIGYPGQERIIVGCRGVFRALVRVHGLSAHSGSTRRRGVNAVSRAVQLVAALEQAELGGPSGESFPLPPSLTVSAIHAGEGFSTVPDVCTVNVDFRLTPTYDANRARSLLEACAAAIDGKARSVRPTEIETLDDWPAYRLPASAPVFLALRSEAQRVLGRELDGGIAGPSSVGNYLATLGIGATSGFGVNYRNLHGADECIELASLEPAHEVYLAAVRRLLG